MGVRLLKAAHLTRQPPPRKELAEGSVQSRESTTECVGIYEKGLIFLSCCPDISVPPATHASLDVDSKYARLNALVIPTRGMGQQLAKGLWPFSFVPM
jgi:hypothetical protein